MYNSKELKDDAEQIRGVNKFGRLLCYDQRI